MNAYGVISLVRLFPAAKWQLLACANPPIVTCVPVFVVLSSVAACMYLLPYVTSV